MSGQPAKGEHIEVLCQNIDATSEEGPFPITWTYEHAVVLSDLVEGWFTALHAGQRQTLRLCYPANMIRDPITGDERRAWRMA